MRISSRTPEGHFGDCPICKKQFRIATSPGFGDATCPHCNSLIWFFQLSSEPRVFEASKAEELRKRVETIAAKLLGVTERQVRENPSLVFAEGDSLDTAELLLELETELTQHL